MLAQIKNFAVEPIDANLSEHYQDPELYDGTTVNPWISVMGEHEDQGARVILNCHEDHAVEIAARLNSWPLLADRVRILREALGEVRRMASVKGRWLDDTGCAVESEENDGTNPNVRPDVEGCLTWEEYTIDEQNAALEAIEERALAALEATKKTIQ